SITRAKIHRINCNRVANSGYPARTTAGSLLAEEATLNCFVQRQVRSASEIVGNPSRIFGDQRHRSRPDRIRLFTAIIEKRREPILPGVQRAKIAIVLASVGTTGPVPILVREQKIAQHSYVAERERQSLSPTWIGGGCGIADQRDTGVIGLRDPGVCRVEGGQWPDSFGACEKIGRHSASDALIDEARQSIRTLYSQVTVASITNICAKAAIALRRDK